MLKARKTGTNNNNGYILRLRQSRMFKGISMTLVLSLIFEMIQPSVSMALTEGPSQPEVQSFEPIGTTQMVDLFTGDFNYNIPLFNLPGPNGGYPVNIAYHAGVSMDDEASWVGLGWNLNVGALVRNMRGLPDEFLSEHTVKDQVLPTALPNGDKEYSDYIETKTDMKESWTLGVNYGLKLEILGGELSKDQFSASIRYNNYRGLGASVGVSTGFGDSPFNGGLSLDSDNGLGVTASVTLKKYKEAISNNFNLGVSFDGMVSLSYGLSRSEYGLKSAPGSFLGFRVEQVSGSSQLGSSLSFARSNFTPSIGNKVNNYNIAGSLAWGTAAPPVTMAGNSFGISFNIQDFDNDDKKGKKRPVVGYAKFGSASSSDYFTQDFVRLNDGQITPESAILPVSYYSNDAYSSTGQGINGYFKGNRTDVGRVHDPKLRNTTLGGSADFEIASAAVSSHFGVGGSGNMGWDTQGVWDNRNDMKLNFNDPISGGIEENHYYQVHGEQTILHPNEYDYVNGTSLALIQFDEKDPALKGKRKITGGAIASQRTPNVEDRVVRNTLIHSLKNKEVEHLGEFKVPYYSYSPSTDLSQAPSEDAQFRIRRAPVQGSTDQVNIENHNAGFKVLNEDGTYYVYALPAYNTIETENLFSVETPTSQNDPWYHNSQFNVDVDEDTQANEVEYKKQGTHKSINKTTKSPYAHSYMLTSVQGADYVDLTNNGPTVDDLGYWVKFSYIKYGDHVKWRAPFHGANYSQGKTYTGQDDKGSYQYGEKEQWYMGRMETKSHIAIFEMSERNDMKEAAGEFVNSGMGTKSGLKIDKIKIYERSSFEDPTNSNPIPLQVVHFEYDYSLCQGVLNNDGAGPTEPYQFADMTAPYGNVEGNQGGKLTLKRLYFTSLNSTRGSKSPYEFDYTSVNIDPNYQNALKDGGIHDLVNPNFQQSAYDPWGGYRPYLAYTIQGYSNGTFNGGYQQHANFPYVAQTSQGWQQQWSNLYPNSDHETNANKKLTQQANDLIASTWSLREITLPSGGKINIEYECDDYSHVQHKVANQMFKIVKVGADNNPPDRLYDIVNENGYYHNEQSTVDEKRRRIYFKLEEPIPVSKTAQERAEIIYEDYVEPIIKDESGKRNLYFKSRMRLTSNANNKVYEYIRGYLPLEDGFQKIDNGLTHYNCGVLETSVTSNGFNIEATFIEGSTEYYSVGYVTIEPARKKKDADGYFDQFHPMALAAWTFMQTDAPELLNPSASMNSVSSPNNTGEVLSLFTTIFGVIPSTLSSFGAIRPYCKGKRFARYIDLENSGIRLASPDRKKFGGGHRVKQISISDEWSSDTGSSEQTRTYGQVYEYTTTDEKTGEVISSGVAQYEPQAGGDENALKYPIYFYGKNRMFTNNNLFAEAPMNEALFPGAMVGYRKVTVRSLNTSDQMRKEAAEPSGSLGTPRGRTGGITEHQFYTSKDFPTMVKWSELHPANNTKDVFNVPIPIPFIGSIKRNYYHGSQAFRIELNDMHGKPKSVKAYELNEYERNGAPITESIYEYQSTSISYQGETVKQLVNTVDVLPQSSGQDLTNTVSRQMGLEVDLFTDQRENKSFWNSGGLDFNVDIASIIPFLSFWPSYSNHKTLFRTYVTNKVVHRTGILKKTKTRDLQTVNESEVLAYDEKAGTPLVSRVKNEFGDYFYSYNIPAYYHYDRMGHAYRNINYSFNCTPSSLVMEDPAATRSTAYMEVPATADMKKYLVRGDELLIIDEQTGESNLYGKGYFLGWAYNGSTTLAKIQVLDYLNEGIESYSFKVIRSGRRNHYGSMAANYLTKGKLQFGDPSLGQFANTGPGTNENQDLAELDNVLSATASLFKDDWGTTSSTDLSFDGITKNPFLSGNSGIWRPFKSYTYVGERKGYSANIGNNTSDDPKLYEDGVMDNVPMFSWDLGNMEDYDLNWEWVNEVTRFSPDAYEVENRNRLGIYSSALYGYDNSLSIAVGGNASVHELGVFDFETSENGVSGLGKLLAQTNMNFDNNRTDNLTHVIMTEQYDILSAEMGANNVMTITTNVDASNFNAGNYVEGGKVGLTLRSRKTLTSASSSQSWTNEGFYFNGGVTGTSVNGNNQIVFNVMPFIEKSGETLNLVEDGTKYVGKITLFTERPLMDIAFAPTSAECEYISGIAHTGDKSMLVKQISLFDQPQLKLIKGKEYVYSMWVRKTNPRVPTYEPGKHGNPSTSLVELGIMSGVSFDNSSSQITINKTTYSKIIEGWQKIDIEFKVNIDNAVLAVYFLRYGGDSFYVDDIRFSPKTGGITTYVYDPNRFWLRASLNVDNYATFFYYDEEGNLTLKEQETEEGIFTITESRGHVSEN